MINHTSKLCTRPGSFFPPLKSLGTRLSIHPLIYNDGITYNIEDSGERAPNIVEGHTKILEREIVEDNHTYKYYREGKNL